MSYSSHAASAEQAYDHSQVLGRNVPTSGGYDPAQYVSKQSGGGKKTRKNQKKGSKSKKSRSQTRKQSFKTKSKCRLCGTKRRLRRLFINVPM